MQNNWFCEFWNCKTNKKEYREYPVSFYKNKKAILKMLDSRQFLLENEGWQLVKLEKYNPTKNPITELFGNLIYNK